MNLENQQGETTEVFQKVLSKCKILIEFTPKSFPSPELLRRNVHALLAYYSVSMRCSGSVRDDTTRSTWTFSTLQLLKSICSS